MAKSFSETFSRVAHWTARQCGRAYVFIIAVGTIIAWVASGPVFGYSDTWQLVINTGTTIITFLMVFLIQNTQNRDTAAIQLKLDELIRATQNARNKMLLLEDLTEDELQQVKATFAALVTPAGAAVGSARNLRQGREETGEALEDGAATVSPIGAGRVARRLTRRSWSTY